MSQNHYKLYLENVIALAETLVIKSDYSAYRQNEYMAHVHGNASFNPGDKTTWKYYLNLSGEYHALDKRMTVTSLDTLQEIEFNKANLAVHKQTAEAYQYGSRYYRELLLRFPENEIIILGILYPVDIQVAINAPDFSVLAYPSYLVEEHEYSLITNINEWLDKWRIRWHSRTFHLSDELYGVTNLGIMYLQLVPLILNLRMQACRTSEVHSYHLQQYLGSHGFLNRFYMQLTRKQALWLYRNIRYIERHSGKQDTFEWLIENILSERGIPLSEFNMLHNTTDMPADLRPEATFVKTLLNEAAAQNAVRDNYYTTAGLLKKEIPLTTGNADYVKFHGQEIDELLERSYSGELKTKVLESAMIDYTDAVPQTLHSVYINQWIYFANTSRMPVYIRVPNPHTGVEMVMSTKNAYLYFLYAHWKLANVTMDTIPPLFVQRRILEEDFGVQKLTDIVDGELITSDEAQTVYDSRYQVGAVTTLEEYRKTCQDAHKQIILQHNFHYKEEHLEKRAYYEAMVTRLYADELMVHDQQDKSYPAFLAANGLAYEDLTLDEWQQLYESIYEKITGVDMTVTANIASVQKAMIGIMQQLSSYSIQLLTDINKDAIKTPHWEMLRFGKEQILGRGYQEIMLGLFRIFNVDIKTHGGQWIELEHLFVDFNIEVPPIDGGLIEIPIDIIPDDWQPHENVIDLGIYRVNVDTLPLPVVSPPETWDNFANFFAMTDEERAKIKDVYCDCFPEPVMPEKVDISDLLSQDILPGFEYVRPEKTVYNMFNYTYIPKYTYHFVYKTDSYILDGFWPFHEPVDVDHFQLFKGNESVDAFKFWTDMPYEVELNNFNSTGGIEFVEQFEQGGPPGFTFELPENAFTNTLLTYEVDVDNPYTKIDRYVLDGAFVNSAVTTVIDVRDQFTGPRTQELQGFVSSIDTQVMPTWISSAGSYVVKFANVVPRMHILPRFRYLVATNVLPKFVQSPTVELEFASTVETHVLGGYIQSPGVAVLNPMRTYHNVDTELPGFKYLEGTYEINFTVVNGIIQD